MKPIESKWPGCIIVGKPVTPQQAIDIAFDTCNTNYMFTGKVELAQRVRDLQEKSNKWSNPGISGELDYLDNFIVPTGWVGGNSNWIHRDGTIFQWHNIGKWPSDEEVEAELNLLASRFPYLDMVVSIMSDEIEFLQMSFLDVNTPCRDVVLPDDSKFIHQYVVANGKVTKQEYDPSIVVPLLPTKEQYTSLNTSIGGTYFTPEQMAEFTKRYEAFYAE